MNITLYTSRILRVTCLLELWLLLFSIFLWPYMLFCFRQRTHFFLCSETIDSVPLIFCAFLILYFSTTRLAMNKGSSSVIELRKKRSRILYNIITEKIKYGLLCTKHNTVGGREQQDKNTEKSLNA